MLELTPNRRVGHPAYTGSSFPLPLLRLTEPRSARCETKIFNFGARVCDPQQCAKFVAQG